MRKLLLILFLCATPASAQSLQERMLQAEDARATTEAGLAPLMEGLKGSGRRTAIRAIGRLERPVMIPLVAPALDDGVGIRAEAANALAQMARTPAAVVEVQKLLLNRAAIDANLNTWEPWGEIAAALGRLPYDTAEQVAATEAVLTIGLPSPDSMNDVDSAALVGSARGFESLARTVRAKKLAPLNSRTWDLLRWAATAQRPAADPRSVLTRRLAMAALVTGNQVTASVIERGQLDADGEVRRLATAGLATDAAISERDVLLKKGMADMDARVRLEALRGWGRHLQETSCALVRAAVKDADAHVRTQAIDQLGAGCPASEGSSELGAIVGTLSTQPRTWHAPAHALVSLARTEPAAAARALPLFVAHPTWQVRMYAARAASALGAVDTLMALMGDPVDNVREAALSALIELKRPEAVAAAIDSLTRIDYQLVLTAVRALSDVDQIVDGKTHAPTATSPLLTALGRITKESKDTSRDPRMAILNRLQGYGDASQAVTLEGYLKDFDPAVAAKAAEILTAWTGRPRVASAQPLIGPGVTVAAVNALRGKALRFHMTGTGSFDIALDVDAAPLSVLRVARRAGEGYYNGLTFHRIALNFVIQGGSPGANEYTGDSFFMRDEVGLHLRGTVGISTRGRDTGDAQIFVNTVDSPRLDHTYTVFGTVTAGMEVVDGVREGDVIQRVELVTR